MKLKPEFITQTVDDQQFLIAVGPDAFSGIVRSNKTGAAIIDLLKQETTQAELVAAMCARFDAPEAVIAADVQKVLDLLRSIRALDE